MLTAQRYDIMRGKWEGVNAEQKREGVSAEQKREGVSESKNGKV